jgi:hypothetical protein
MQKFFRLMQLYATFLGAAVMLGTPILLYKGLVPEWVFSESRIMLILVLFVAIMAAAMIFAAVQYLVQRMSHRFN